MDSFTHENFKEIVLNGLYEENGMKGFSDILDEKNIFEVHSYIVDVATKEREKNIFSNYGPKYFRLRSH